MMNSRDYWLQREAEQLKHNITDEAEYDRELKRIYQEMLDACQKEIESFYAKYASAEGISIAEAKKRVKQHDVKAFERTAARYVKEKNFSKRANEELRLYNATMKINRLEMLKANIGLEMIAGHDKLEKFMGGILKGRTMDELKRQAGILGKTIKNNAQLANAIVNGSFHNGTFSDRIWQYQDIMRQDLGKLLQQGLIQGKGARAIAKDLKKYWYGNDPKTGGGATYCMERLMRTELARVQTEAQKQSFERNGFEMYQFICNVNPTKHGTCPVCQRLANQDKGLGKGVYLVADMMPGTNAPPMHPHCRCSTAAYEDDEEYEAWLDYLDKGGTTAEWNETGKAEWEKQRKKAEKEAAAAETIENANQSIEELKERLSRLDEDMEKATTLGEMVRIQDEQEAIYKKISQIEQEEREAEKKKLVTEAEKAITSSGMFKKVSLDGCDADSSRAIVSAVEKVKARYPEATLSRVSISRENFKGAVFAGSDALGRTVATQTFSGGVKKQPAISVVFNRKYFSNGRTLKELLKAKHESGFSASSTIEGIVVHEIGHALCNLYNISELDIYRAVVANSGMDWRKTYGGTSKEIYESAMHISKYGDTSIDEWFAECFADYLTNSNPKNVSIAAVEAFDRMVSKK